MKKAFVLLSGCGNRDGSEIRESVLALLSLDMHGITPICIAPVLEQAKTINHWESKEETTPRIAIVEAARIARGEVMPIDDALSEEADMLVIPGGLGAATTLSSYMTDQEHATVLPSVEKLIFSFYQQKKPIVAICISPVLIAITLCKKASVRLTLGTNKKDLAYLSALGMEAVPCDVDSCVVDTKNTIVSTPAYMGKPSLALIWNGINAAITEATKMLDA